MSTRSTKPTAPSSKRSLAICLALLIIFSALVQSLVVSRAALPALDCLRSVAAAQALTQTPNLETLVSEPEPPLFPLILAVVHESRSEFAGAIGAPAPHWGTSAQLAAALALVLLPIPVFLLSLQVIGRREALLAAAIACAAPPVAQLGAEGIRDAWHLLLLATATACYVHARGRAAFSAAGGALLALAMLVRAEAALLALAFGILTTLERLGPGHLTGFVRSEKSHSALTFFNSRHDAADVQRLVWFALGLALPIVTWLFIAGDLTPRAAMHRLLARAPARDGWVFNSPTQQKAATGAPFDSESFDLKEPGNSTRRRGLWRAAAETVDELFLATAYALIPLALFGWRLRNHDDPWDALAWIATLLWILAGFANVLATGYLSSRHLLPVVLFLAPRAAEGCFALVSARHLLRPLRATLRIAALLITLGGVVWLARPLHQDRAGHRLAAAWITSRGESGAVLDSWGWTALFDASPTYRYDAAREAFADPLLTYVVVEERELSSGSPRSETLRRLLAENGSQVDEFAPAGAQSPVLLFHWRPRLAQNVRAALR